MPGTTMTIQSSSNVSFTGEGGGREEFYLIYLIIPKYRVATAVAVSKLEKTAQKVWKATTVKTNHNGCNAFQFNSRKYYFPC